MHNLSFKPSTIGITLKRAGHWGAVALSAVVIAGCALPESMRRPDKEVVAEKAQQRWDALVKGDFATAYRYISPAGRKTVTQAAYASQLKAGFWTGAKVQDVRCPTAEACEVDVTVEYQALGLRTKTPVREQWVKADSDWWFVLGR